MYNDYFGFREKPFNLTPDPRFFYENPVYREAYANLLYAIRERKGFSVLIGEAGTGKTTLLLRLMDQLGASIRFAFVYNPRLSFDELLSFMCEEFLLSVKGKNRLEKIQALNEFLMGQLRSGSTAALLVDEAQNLDEKALENLRLLSNLETADEKLLQIVLVGQPELPPKLDDPRLRQLKQRIAVWSRLSRLKEKEVGDFIRHRLDTVGYRGGELFASRAIRQIADATQGIPRLINIVCDNALVIAYAKSRKAVSPEIVREVARDLRLGPGEPFEAGEEEPEEWTVGDGADGWGRPQPQSSRRSGSGPGRWARRSLEGFLWIVLLAGLLSFISPLELQAVIPELSIQAGRTFDALRDTLKTFQSSLRAYRDDKSQSATLPPGPKPALDAESPPVAASAQAAAGDPAAGPPPRPQADAEQAEQDVADARPAADPAAPPAQPDVEPAAENPRSGRVAQLILVEHATSIARLVRTVYGGDNTLAIDLADEYNPHIGDLERLRAGDRLWLPPLSREFLLRRQPDGTYHLILTSFRSSVAADRFARSVERRGFVVAIKPKKVFGDRSLHRIEIVGLNDLGAAERAWRLAEANHWLEREGGAAADAWTRAENR